MQGVMSLPSRYAAIWPAVYWTLAVIGAAYCAAAIAGLVGFGGCGGEIVPCDAAAYYFADGYANVPTTPQFGYSPAFDWAFEPFRRLPFELFIGVWFALHVLALLWLRAAWLMAVPGINEDLIRGNISVFVAVAIVLALRYPAAWAFPLLTKVLPGIGVVWHVVRREWSALAWAAGVTAAIVTLVFIFGPGAWSEWVALLQSEGTGAAATLLPRIVIGILVVAYAAATSRPWLLPVGLLTAWSVPWPPAWMVLAAIPRLRSLEGDSEGNAGHSS